MKIIIDIPEEEYEEILWSEDCGLHTLTKAIANGTPIIEGPDKLVGINIIQSIAKKKAEDHFPEGRFDYGYRKALFDFAKQLEEMKNDKRTGN